MPAKISKQRIGEMLQIALSELKNMGGEARVRDLYQRIEPKLKLNQYEKATYEKSGYVRWQSILHFYSIGCLKAGYLQKSGGKWILTTQGEEALKMPSAEFIQAVQEKYRAWKASRSADGDGAAEELTEAEETERVVRQTAYEQAYDQAQFEIESHIQELSWYDFQKLVADLLTAMGYRVGFIAPPGPDGGIDIVAYKDPLGTSIPRIKVQIKHRVDRVKVQEVRELHGLLKEEDVGIFVSSGGFTRDAVDEARKTAKHIEVIDLSRFIVLWQQYYDNISESGKSLLPLRKLFFLAPLEES
jgi:restriction system protein